METVGNWASRTGLAPDALRDQVAVVTGAGRGIGRRVAEALADLGARVAVVDVTGAGRQTVEGVIANGGRARFFCVDVSDEDATATLADAIVPAWGAPTILINNAIICPVASVVDTSADLWDRVMAVNLRGTFLMCRAFLPSMEAAGAGTILNMVSTDAMPFLSAYIASKQGIVGFSQSLAAEVGPMGLRVVPFVPGMVDTPGLREAAVGLAPWADMTVEEFMAMAMPAERAATATVALAVSFAEEYHGEIVDAYQILDRLAGMRHDVGPGPAGDQDASESGTDRLAALVQELLGIVVETSREFERLPVFFRPLAQRGIRKKTGLRIQDWEAALDELAEARLVDDSLESFAGWSRLIEALDGLARYYHEVPGETARFVRDEEVLQEIAATASRREAAARALATELLRSRKGEII